MPDGGGEDREDSGKEEGDTSEGDELWNKLSTEEKAAGLKYLKSMVDEDDDEDEDEEGDTEEEPTPDEAPMPDSSAGPMPEAPMPDASAEPMAESVVFSNRQLRKLNESFGIQGLEDLARKDKPTKKTKKTLKKDKKRNDNPFNSPRR